MRALEAAERREAEVAMELLSASTRTNATSTTTTTKTNENASASPAPLKPSGDEMEARRSSVIGAGVDRQMYFACLRHLATNGRWREAIEVFERMPANGTAPSIYTLGAVLDACGKAGQWKKCIELLGTAKTKLGLKLNGVVYTSAISACSRASQGGPALSLMRTMQSEGIAPTVFCYTSVIAANGKCGEWEIAVEILREMPSAGVKPNQIHYNTAMIACAGAQQWKMAVELLREMKAAGVAPNDHCYTTVISACAQVAK